MQNEDMKPHHDEKKILGLILDERFYSSSGTFFLKAIVLYGESE